MTLRSITLRAGAALAVATITALSLAGPASAAPSADRDCKDFPNRGAAQAALNADPSDPDGLDRDNDGLACEDFEYPGSGTGSSTTPGREPGPGTGSATPEPTGGREPAGSEPDGDAAPDRPGRVAAVPAGGVEAGDGSADDAVLRDGGSGTAFVLTGFGVVLVAGAACSVRGARRPAADTGPSVPRPRAASDDRPSARPDTTADATAHRR